MLLQHFLSPEGSFSIIIVHVTRAKNALLTLRFRSFAVEKPRQNASVTPSEQMFTLAVQVHRKAQAFSSLYCDHYRELDIAFSVLRRRSGEI
ncbi:hypothetical protein [Microvirga pudoricolor]|uniref:hypothetical protein n=1 Tax=Microvirga pudoricolor TaxID=2778729 RepID=UPI00194DB287|nr:hypothetical protein [Microvirga pudoricolor]MBM6592573.1 hypothetical protein [Microvirga pudoricolor]